MNYFRRLHHEDLFFIYLYIIMQAQTFGLQVEMILTAGGFLASRGSLVGLGVVDVTLVVISKKRLTQRAAGGELNLRRCRGLLGAATWLRVVLDKLLTLFTVGLDRPVTQAQTFIRNREHTFFII